MTNTVGNELSNIANRIIRAEDSFAEFIMERTGCCEEIATKVVQFYKANKLVKIDKHVQGWTVKHGALLNDNILNNAVAHVSA